MAYEETAKELAKSAPPKKTKAAADPLEDGDDASESGADEMDSYDSVEDSAADELASLAGVEDKAAFKAALGDYVKACVQREMSKE